MIVLSQHTFTHLTTNYNQDHVIMVKCHRSSQKLQLSESYALNLTKKYYIKILILYIDKMANMYVLKNLLLKYA